MLHTFVVIQAIILGIYVPLCMFILLDNYYVASFLNPFLILLMMFVGVVSACTLMVGCLMGVSTTLLIAWLCTWAGSAMVSTLVGSIVMSCIE